MQVTLKLKLSNTKYATNNRDAFWSEYCRQAGLTFQPDDIFADASERVYSPSRMEALLWQTFIPRLNDAISYRYGNRGDGPGRIMVVGAISPPLANIAITLQRVEYNSLDLILKVFGLEDASLVPLLAAALEIYSSDTLEHSMPGNNVSMKASTDFDKENSDSPPSKTNRESVSSKSDTIIGRGNEAFQSSKRLWAIVNGSLLLPLLLALAITYVAFQGILEEKNDQIKQESALSQERTAVLNGILQQNVALNRTLTELMHSQPAPNKATSAPQ